MYLSRAEIVPVISSDAVSLVVGAPARVARPSAIGDDTCMLQVGVAFSVRARDPIPDSKPEPRWRFGKGERLSCHGQDLLTTKRSPADVPLGPRARARAEQEARAAVGHWITSSARSN